MYQYQEKFCTKEEISQQKLMNRKQDGGAAIFKKYVSILGKILYKRRNQLAKTYEQQTTKHLPGSKSY